MHRLSAGAQATSNGTAHSTLSLLFASSFPLTEGQRPAGISPDERIRTEGARFNCSGKQCGASCGLGAVLGARGTAGAGSGGRFLSVPEVAPGLGDHPGKVLNTQGVCAAIGPGGWGKGKTSEQVAIK